MKTICLLLLATMLSCEKESIIPNDDLVTGYWEGLMFVENQTYPIEFYLNQSETQLGGYFIIPVVSNDVLSLDVSSSCKGNNVSILVFDKSIKWNYIFTGIVDNEKIIGDYHLTVDGKVYKGIWIVYNN